jgi:hypothetical protein
MALRMRVELYCNPWESTLSNVRLIGLLRHVARRIANSDGQQPSFGIRIDRNGQELALVCVGANSQMHTGTVNRKTHADATYDGFIGRGSGISSQQTYNLLKALHEVLQHYPLSADKPK